MSLEEHPEYYDYYRKFEHLEHQYKEQWLHLQTACCLSNYHEFIKWKQLYPNFFRTLIITSIFVLMSFIFLANSTVNSLQEDYLELEIQRKEFGN
jgi:hypothetical protein